VFYGPNGAGKTTISRFLATKHKGLQIQLDWFSSMQRGKTWHKKLHCIDRIHMLIGLLNGAISKTKYTLFFIDGVFIYPEMFSLLENWSKENNFTIKFIKITGDTIVLDNRIKKRKKIIKDWNKTLPSYFKKFSYENESLKIDTTKNQISAVTKDIEKKLGLT